VAEETKKPDSKSGSGMQKKSFMGMPQWMVVAGGAMLVAIGYMYWRNKQIAASNASASNTGTPSTLAQYGGDLSGQSSAVYSQLLNLQQQLSNLSQTATPTGYSQLPWESTGDTGDMSLNALADFVNTTPQAIIDNTKAAYQQNGTGWDFNTDLGNYFNQGNFDAPIPQGYLLYVPVLAPAGKGAQLTGQNNDVVPPVETGYYSPPQPAGGF
jgi:hypothetical protein